MPANSAETAEICARFAEIFGHGDLIRIIRSPGRVNLIGEHTDYNDGFVFPMAIEPCVTIACRPRGDGKVRLASTAFEAAPVEFSVNETIQPGEPAWANYPKGVAAQLKKAGIPLVGMDALFSNTLPLGGGLSSSAAMEVGTGRALLAVAGTQMDNQRLALLCQMAEQQFAGVPCGIMDQTIVADGRAGHAMLLDCRDFSKKFIPIDPMELRVVIVNSLVKHALSDGEYGKRRRQCEQGVEFFRRNDPAIKALRDVSPELLATAEPAMSDEIFRRCRHVVGEIQRTTQAADELEQRHYERFGELMVQSHASLRDDYQVSVPELDFLVEEAIKVKGVYGARMTGGGFGGCIVALVQPRAVDRLSANLREVYSARFGKQPPVYVTQACDGAAVIQ